jgi:hypothetical protein
MKTRLINGIPVNFSRSLNWILFRTIRIFIWILLELIILPLNNMLEVK